MLEVTVAKIDDRISDLTIMHSPLEVLSTEYPNLAMLRQSYCLISPSNMTLERGFSITDWLMPKRRQLMSHELYVGLKLVFSVFPRDSFEVVCDRECETVSEYMNTAASVYTRLSKEQKKVNEEKEKM